MFQAIRRTPVRAFVCGTTMMTKAANAATVPAAMKQIQVRGVASLGGALMKEYKEEAENTEENEEFVKIREQIEQTFKIEDKPGSSVVKVTGAHKDENILVSFDVQDEVMDESNNDENFDEEGNFIGEEDEEDHPYVNRFIVEVKKGPRTLAFDCVAGEDVEIRSVQILGDNLSYGSDKTTEMYSGPSFPDLDDDLREAFYEYLRARKIDHDFSFFVRSYAHDKEQREYVNWLKSVGEFVGDSKPLLK